METGTPRRRNAFQKRTEASRYLHLDLSKLLDQSSLLSVIMKLVPGKVLTGKVRVKLLSTMLGIKAELRN